MDRLTHDLANWLAAAIGHVGLLVRLDLPEAAADVAADLQAILSRCSDLVDELRRPRAATPTRLDLNRLLTDLHPLLRATCDPHVEFNLISERDLWITADATQVERLLLNLVINASEAQAAKGGACSVTALDHGSRVAIVVADDGPGIDPSDLPHVFEPWYTTAPLRGGKRRGLGLAIVRAAVSELGGELAVESVPGTGTTFTILFPRAPEGDPCS